MDKLLTILIPTKNRHLLLDRSLLYYVKSSIHVRIIIADSSDNALRNNTKKVFDKYSNSLNIDYFHAPENIEASTKNNIAIDMVRTPYVLNVGDDDFPLKSSIETILSKLEKDSSISAAFGDRIAITQVSNKEDNKKWINSENLSEKYQVQEYSEFGNHQKYDVIINFVGIGDPAKAQKMGSDIFKVTEQYDDMALEYLKQHKKTKYIFLSSGAVYGGNYQDPVDKDTVATIDINNLKSTDWYTLAKLYAEAKHRSLSDLPIVDVRVFNYFSHRQNMDSRFLITDVVRAIKNKEVFKTSADNIVRDFVTPPDFYGLIRAIIDSESINAALDCYTKSPVSKFDLLYNLKNKFGLNYEVDNSIKMTNATGVKKKYYSKYMLAEKVNYTPHNSSLSGIISEMEIFFNKF